MSAKPVILVVDDDPPILLLMKNVLREFGFEARLASTGAEALESVRESKPDLVLVDKNMPGMSGAELIRALRGQQGLGDLPVLVLSGEPVDPIELQDLGANDGVQKPFDVAGLIERIRSFVGLTRD